MSAGNLDAWSPVADHDCNGRHLVVVAWAAILPESLRHCLLCALILSLLKRTRKGDMSSVKTGFYDKGGVRIRYQEVGSGFPLFAVPGGGLNSRIINWPNAVINMMEEFKADFRVITMDQRNATNGESTGPVPVDNPWDAFADDQLGLMNQLGVRQFAFFGNCIGGSFAMKLMQRAPDRVVAAIISQTIGHLPENPDVMWNHSRDGWAKEFRERRPEVTMATIEQYFHNLYRVRPDFVYSVSRDFARNCQTPILVLRHLGIRCQRRDVDRRRIRPGRIPRS